ncbi:NAD(P)-binding protein [Clavulina sp. PMI_390]|nr:NAD(P)-binding protein [Clavulina sp. PMI_390]
MPSKVIATEAEGYIALATLKLLIKRSYSVVGVVRTPGLGELARGKLGPKFSYVVIPDKTKSGAFDGVLQANPDASSLIHMVPLVSLTAMDPEHIVPSSVFATTVLLESLKKYGNHLKRVVITSSAWSSMELIESPAVYCEKDWPNYATAYIQKQVDRASIPSIFLESKVRSEQLVWDFMKNNQAINFELLTLQPILAAAPDDELTAAESEALLDVPNLCPASADVIKSGLRVGIIDARQTALAHVLALQCPNVGGQRLAFSEDPKQWEELRRTAMAIGLQDSAC